MKRFNSSDSLGVMVSICPPNDDGSSKNNNGYSREFQAMLDSFDKEDGAEETGLINGKKRRLSLEKVKALEKYFEVDNKLEPERKAKIAEELGLQPRQVAIWFQNRRVRWKAKQLEKDYGFLRSDYDDLKRNYECLEREKATLNAEVRQLKSKLHGRNEMDNPSFKEEALFSESENNVSEQSKISLGGFYGESEPNILELKRLVEFKDGSSDTDSSEMLILNDSNLHHHHHLWISPASSCSPELNFASSVNWFQLSNTREMAARANHNQFGQVGEQSFYGVTEEYCNFLSVDQSPAMHWYNLDQSD